MNEKKNRIKTILPIILVTLLSISVSANIYQLAVSKWGGNSNRRTSGSSAADKLTGAYTETISCSGKKTSDDINILFIGNSFTLHGYADYWWGKWGMAASEKENDFVHNTAAGLATNSDVHLVALNYFIWEKMTSDSAETFPIINPYIKKNLDYVVIQLGENVSDFTNFQVDLEGLIDHVRDGAPDAQILVVGMAANADVDNMKRAASESSGASFVDISNMTDWQCGLGTTVKGDDGKDHVVEHEGVAGHPGDKGHRQIADRILAAINV